jgi:hemolysin activation/secretion protein
MMLRAAMAGLAALWSVGAAAQVTGVPLNRSDLVPPQQRAAERTTTLSIDGDLERAPCALDQPQYADLKLTLKGARFAGIEPVREVALDAAYASYLEREVPVSALCDIRARANALLRAAGYLASVEIPEQSLAGGVPQFVVVLGRITAIRVRGEAGPSEKLVERILQKLTRAEVFNTREAERILLLADDLPGLDVRLSLRPAAGGAPGDLLGEVAIVGERAALDLNIQNFGSEAVGRFGGLLRGELYNLTGLGDRTSLTVFSTLEFAEQQTVQLGHDFRVGSNGLRVGAQLTYSNSNPSINLPGFALEAETVFASLFASYPLLRRRAASQYLEAGFDLADQNVTVNALPLTRDRVRMMFVRLSGEATDEGSVQRQGGYNQYEPRFKLRYLAELRQGLGVFSANPDCRPNLAGCLAGGAVPPSRIEANPQPLLLRFDLGAEYRPVPRFALAMRVSGQVSGDPLPAFEEYAGGSFSIGRGYDPGSVLGDNGVGASLEARYGSLAPKGAGDVALQPYVFTDIVRVWNEDPSQRGLNPDRLWSAGGGLRAAWGSRMQADALLAVPLERPQAAATRGDVRLLVSLTARLFPWRF